MLKTIAIILIIDGVPYFDSVQDSCAPYDLEARTNAEGLGTYIDTMCLSQYPKPKPRRNPIYLEDLQ